MRARLQETPDDDGARAALGDHYEARGDLLGAATVRAGFLPVSRDEARAYLVQLVDSTRRGARVEDDPRMRPVIASPQVMLWLRLLLDAAAKPERVPELLALPKSRRAWVVPKLLEARLRTAPTLDAVDALEVLGYLDTNYDGLDANELVTLVLRTPPGESLRMGIRRILGQRDLAPSVIKGAAEQRLRARLESLLA